MASRSALDDDLSEDDFLQRRPRRRTWGRTFSVSKTRTGPWGKALKVGTVAILGAAALGIAAKLGHSAAQICKQKTVTPGGVIGTGPYGVTPGGVIGTGPYGNRPPGQAGSPPPSFQSQAEADAAFFSDPLIRETMDSQLPSSSQRRANEEAYEGNFVSASSAAPAWWLPEEQQNEPIPVVPLPDFSWMLRYVPQRVFDAVNTVNRWIDARERIPVRQDRESGERWQYRASRLYIFLSMERLYHGRASTAFRVKGIPVLQIFAPEIYEMSRLLVGCSGAELEVHLGNSYG